MAKDRGVSHRWITVIVVLRPEAKYEILELLIKSQEFCVGEFGTKSMGEGIFLAFFYLGTNHKLDRFAEQSSAWYIPKAVIQVRIGSITVLGFRAQKMSMHVLGLRVGWGVGWLARGVENWGEEGTKKTGLDPCQIMN